MYSPTARCGSLRAAATLCLALGAVATVPRSAGAAVVIDAQTDPGAPTELPFPIGGAAPDGQVFSANSRYLTLDGRPCFPVGEFHYSRYPAAEWEREILKMKAGGITVVSTYVFWIHHEEVEGRFDWSGQRDLGQFVALCRKHGLLVWLRIGPWDHGEVRNGGFPDWLVKSGLELRQSDPGYLAQVRRFDGEIARQVRGMFWRDGGPIIGVQIENEYHPERGGLEHMRDLLQIARDVGMVAPFYSATGWDNAAVPATGFLPVFGGYTEQFWNASLAPLPPNQNFFFTPIRAEDNVMGDLSPKNPLYNSKYDDFPFLTAEMGGGMAIAYHRRPIMLADDSTAAALVKLGAGVTGLGFYMYHGGTNPDGRTPLEETQSVWNGYNDMEAKAYDFQAPLGEFGQIHETYRTLKTLNLFLGDFGSDLAPMARHLPAQGPANRDDISTPRVAARTEGNRGFVFINNYERNYPLGDKRDFQVLLRLPAGTVAIPRRPTVVPNGAYPIWPVNLDVGGVTLRYATAEPLSKISDPAVLVFFAWPGLKPEFAFATAPGDRVEAPGARVTEEGGRTYVDGLEPGSGVAIRVFHSGKPPTQIVVLTRDQALDFWKAKLGGRDRLLLSPAGLCFDGDRIDLSTRSVAGLQLALFPHLAAAPSESRADGADGIFQRFASSAKFPPEDTTVAIEPVKAADPARPVKLSPPPRAVAMEPDDADFDRAAVWRLRMSGALTAANPRAFLQIDYEGDVARMYVGDRFDDDNFYKGTTWELGLWRYSPAELQAGLQLKILPLRRDAPVFIEPGHRPDFSNAAEVDRLKDVKIALEYQAAMVIGP